jgi:tetratricopeptide (TPR) repeat protein
MFYGCSVFSPIGNSISQGYENMVTYFNGYYNATNLFSEAEEEIKTAAILARGKEIPGVSVDQIPATAKAKLGQVVDKCSNILAFHPSSSYVDNALFLIGKSFFYQAEYLKAERKFIELLAQFPKSSLALEAQLWYARSEEKLGKFEDGLRLGDAVVTAAHTEEENELEAQAHQLLGVLYRRMNQMDKSIAEYEKVIAVSTNDALRGDAQISMGDMYFKAGQYKKAAEVYLKTEEYTSDIYSKYYSALHASIADREMGELNKELSLLNPMIDDFRNREYLASILFERANNYALNARRDDAIHEYIYVDTTYVRTEYGLRSAYQLGLMFEKEGAYQQALKYYSEVNTAAGYSFVADGHRKFEALTRYFNAWRQLKFADSLLFVLSDTLPKVQPDSLHALAADSTGKPASDTLHALVADTVQKQKNITHLDTLTLLSRVDTLNARNAGGDTTRNKTLQVIAKPPLPSADSLHMLKSIAAQELGDIFYSEVVEPDSAFSWYNQSLLWSYNHVHSPRILYILAELSRIAPEKKFPAPEEYHARLDRDFPESVYAEEARRFLHKPSASGKIDPAREYYAQSEKQIDAKLYGNAIETLRFIIQTYPKSPIAAKSKYAMGWIMENKLVQPDSAMVFYKQVIRDHKGSLYEIAASKRSLEDLQADTVKKDTTLTKSILQPIQSIHPDSVQKTIRDSEIDTLKQGLIPPHRTKENARRKKVPIEP